MQQYKAHSVDQEIIFAIARTCETRNENRTDVLDFVNEIQRRYKRRKNKKHDEESYITDG
jgi:hypothetical protein